MNGDNIVFKYRGEISYDNSVHELVQAIRADTLRIPNMVITSTKVPVGFNGYTVTTEKTYSSEHEAQVAIEKLRDIIQIIVDGD